MAKRLAELARAAGILIQPAHWAEIMVTGLCEDSRNVSPGDLFFAVCGHRQDGAQFIAQAVSRGAVAVLVERDMTTEVPVLRVADARDALASVAAAFYDHPTHRLFTVGVTGTNGKTTTCHWIAQLLGASSTTLSTTVQNVADGLSSLTTPSSLVLQPLACAAVNRGDQHLVVEASSAGIDQHRLGAIDFDVCVFTNFSPEHRRHHGGLDAYREAKQKLFRELKPEGWAVLNAGDPLHRTIAEQTSARVVTYAVDAEADLRAGDVRRFAEGLRFSIRTARGELVTAVLPVPGGMYNVANALAALSVGRVNGLPWDCLLRRLSQVRAVPGRAQTLHHEDGRTVVIDFAHNAPALGAILKHLRTTHERVLVVFGCPGDGEREKRAEMGEISARLAHEIFLTSDDPQDEDPKDIAEEIRSGMGDVQSSAVCVVVDRREAVEIALSQAGANDVVLIAGKGHETSQHVRGERVVYSDLSVLQAAGFREEHENGCSAS